MKKLTITILSSLMLIVFSSANAAVLNSGSKDAITQNTGKIAVEPGIETSSTVGGVMAIVIQAFLGLLGMIFLVIVIVAGWKYFTAGGDEGKVEEALSSIQRGVIGLIIIISAYAIAYFVLKNLPGVAGN